jgi:hypothetical protein
MSGDKYKLRVHTNKVMEVSFLWTFSIVLQQSLKDLKSQRFEDRLCLRHQVKDGGGGGG